MRPPQWRDPRVTDSQNLKASTEGSNQCVGPVMGSGGWGWGWGGSGNHRRETGPWYVGVSDEAGLRTQLSSCQTQPLEGLRARHATQMALLPGDTSAPWTRTRVLCTQLRHPRTAGGGRQSPEAQRPPAGDPPGPNGNTQPRRAARGSPRSSCGIRDKVPRAPPASGPT